MPTTIRIGTDHYYAVAVPGTNMFVTRSESSIRLTEKPTIYKSKKYANDLMKKAEIWFNRKFEVVMVIVSSYVLPPPAPKAKTPNPETEKKEPVDPDRSSRIFSLVRTLIEDQTGYPASKVDRSTTLDIMGADSLDAIEIVMLVEDELDISIPDEDAVWTNVGGLVDYLIGLKDVK